MVFAIENPTPNGLIACILHVVAAADRRCLDLKAGYNVAGVAVGVKREEVR